MAGYPVSVNGRTTERKSSWEIVKGRYGKPVLTPIWGTDVTESRYNDVVKPPILTAAEGHNSQRETILKASRPKDMNQDRFDKPVQHPVQGAKKTFLDQATVKERREMTTAEYLMPINEVEIDRSWRTVMNNSRNEKPIRTQVLRTVVTESDCDEFKRRLQTVEADRLVDRNEEDKPGRGQAVALPPGGIRMRATDNRGGRCTDCTKRTMMFGTVQANGDDFSDSLSGLLPPVVNKLEPKEDTGAMHYQWIVRESIMTTEMKMPSNYLEIPELKIPKLFLHLAEEARDVEVNNDLSACTEEVKSQLTGLQSPILVTVMTDSQPIPVGNELVNEVVYTKMMNDEKYEGRCKPMDRANQAIAPDTTEQPIWLGLNPGGRRTASADTGGPVVNTDERGIPVDGLEPVVLLGSELCENETDPVVPVSQDVNLKEHNAIVDRSSPGATQRMTEPSALFTLKTDWMENAADYRPEQSVPLRLNTDQGEHIPTHRVHPGVKMFRAQPVADGPAGPDRTRRPVGTNEMYAVHDDVRPTAGGPVGRFPDPGPLKYSKISSLDDSYQPLFTGPVGTNEMNAINDRSRPTASGPLGRQCSLDPMGHRAMLSLGDGNQPPSVDPVGRPWIPEQPGDRDTDSDNKRTMLTRCESESDTGAPDSVVRTGSDAQTDRANISMANGLTDLNVIPSSSDSAVHSLGERLTQTKSVSRSVAGIPDPVIQTGCDVHTDQANISMVNGPTDSTVISPSSDSDMRGPGERLIQTTSVSECVTGIPDPVPQTGSEVQTDRVNISTDNGRTDWRETSLSSDSGVHSWTEQWENMSENLTDSSVYHTVDSHQEDSGRVSHLEFCAPPNTEEEDDSDYSDTDGLLAMTLDGCPSEETCGQDDRILYSAAAGAEFTKKADIAALSDFSEESSELGVRHQLKCRTPVPVQPILPSVDDADSLRDPQVGASSWFAKLSRKEGYSDGAWTRWDYGTLPKITDPEFAQQIDSMLEERLARDADPRLDRYYPKLVQSLAKARRRSDKMWAEHDTRLNKERTNCTATGCRCSMRGEMMIQTFREEMVRVDSASARFPDRHVRKYVIRFNDGDSQEEVPGTYTPPIRRRRCRKYASLRKYETDVEDYFSCSDEEEHWVNRTNSWYQHC